MIPKKIINFGDVHIFKNKRFDEHEFLFKQFIKDIELEQPDLIVCTGDVIDSKLQISPEQIQLVLKLFTSCLQYAPVILIPGNHDLNLKNKSRVDLLQVIVNTIQEIPTEHKLYYENHSCIMVIPGYDIIWAIWSCIDEQRSPFYSYIDEKSGNYWTNDIKSETYTIGLYHGAVKGCKADNGFVLTEGIDVQEFKNCDLVMLSDIHLHQSFRNNEIVYTSSFLQTKENEESHGGYIKYIWDDIQKKYIWEYKILENPKSTVLINIDNIDDEIKLPDNLYKTQLIKLIYDRRKIEKSSILDLKKKLQNKISNRIDIKPKVINKKLLKPTDNSLKEEKEISSLSFDDILLKYMITYKKELNIKDIDKDFNKFKELDYKYNSSVDNESLFEAGDYFIEKVVVNNLYSFGPTDNIIQYLNDGIVGISGKNAVGKSSIIKLIAFILFEDIPSNTSSFKRIINKYNRHKEAFGELIINKESKRYYIRRVITPKKTDSVSFELEFCEIDEDNNVINELNGEKKQETQKNIVKYFGTKDMFEKLSIFSGQKKQTEFIDCKNSERLSLVTQFLGLHNYEKKYKNANDDLKSDKKIYEDKSKTFEKDLDIDTLNDERDNNLFQIQSITREINTLNNSNIELKDNIKLLEEKRNNYKSITIQKYKTVLEIESLISSKEKKIDLITLNKSNKSNEIQEIENKKNICTEKLEELNVEVITNQNNINNQIEKIETLSKDFYNKEQQKYNEYISNNDKEIRKIEKNNAVIQADIDRLNKQLLIDICNGCGKEFSENDKLKVKEQIDELKKEINSNVLLIDEYKHKEFLIHLEIKNIKDQIKVKEDYERFKSNCEKEVSKRKQDLQSFENELLKIENKYLNVENEIKQLIIDIELLKKDIIISKEIEEEIKDSFIKISEINEIINPIQYLIDKIEKEIKENNFSIGSFTEKNKNIDIKIKEYKEKLAYLSILEENIRLLTMYKNIVNKDGLPLFFLKEKINDVNQEVNLIANQVFDFDVSFKIDEDAGELNLEFLYENDKESCDVSLASGSETFVINLCIKVGLAQLSQLPKLQTLIIDEGFDVLDKVNIDKIPALFQSLLNYYNNIILISHLDELKDLYTSTINLEKESLYTFIV